MPKGLLLVTMEPPASLEEEFHDWYDTEHLPQRRGLPGFETGSRWVCLSGWPRWLATYDLTSVTALDSAEYMTVSGANSTPWTRRVLPRTIGRRRVVAEQVHPGEVLALPTEQVARLVVMRFSDDAPELRAALMNAAAEVEAPAQMRLFRDGRALWALAEFRRPPTAEQIADLMARSPKSMTELVNIYTPYRRA
ncbi:hypothetical protein ACXIUS_26390 [Bosea thiooxidans]